MPCVAVAFSAGRDSTALLHASCAAARALGLAVVALHVHHGLLPQADAWQRHAQAVCARWRRRGAPLRLIVTRLSGQPAAGDSTEAWARRERYAALAAMASQAGASLVLLAQHRRDQAETVLLQALRGAGPAGLAAMPAAFERHGQRFARPWLDQPREAIDAYLARHRLRAVDDPSNADPRFARSRLRAEVWPTLQAAFGDAETALAAVSRHAAEADAALTELAGLDLAQVGSPAVARSGEAGLHVARWLELSPARRANAMRHGCRAALGVGPPDTLVVRLLSELPGKRSGQWPAPGGAFVLHLGRLAFVRTQPTQPAPPSLRAESVLDLSHPGRIAVPAWCGAFDTVDCTAGGVAVGVLARVQLQARSGGEQFQCHPRSVARSLKKQYQALGVPAHQRGGPLVWSGNQLLYVPGLGLDARALAEPGQPQRQLQWTPLPAA